MENNSYYLKWKDIILFKNYLYENKEQIIIIIITYTIQVYKY